MVETKKLFRPVIGQEENILSISPTNGFVYFATDTQKIFLGDNDEFVPMSSSKGFYYGKKDIDKVEDGSEQPKEVYFTIDDLESNKLPEIDDLILNIDGCFYRVISIVSELEVKTERQTLQGTGTSGSAGDGSSSAFQLNMTKTLFAFAETVENMPIIFNTKYKGDDVETNFISTIEILKVNNSDKSETLIYTQPNLKLKFNEEQSVDIISCLDIFSRNSTESYKLAIYDAYGERRAADFKLNVIKLSLTTSMEDIFSSQVATLNYTYTGNGLSGSGVTDSNLVLEFVNVQTPKADPIVFTAKAKSGVDSRIQVELVGLEHGVYNVKAYLQIGISGTSEILTSNICNHVFVYYINEDTEPLLGVYIPEKLEQYTNIVFKYLIVSNTTEDQTLTISVNNIVKDILQVNIDDISGIGSGSFTLYFDQADSYNLELFASSGVSYSTRLTVTEYTGNLPIIDSNDINLMLYLTPRGRSNDSINREVWTDSSAKGAAAHDVGNAMLKDCYFNEASGWLTDENKVPYLKLASGASLEMSDFRFFEYDPTKTTTNSKNWQAQLMGNGFTIEFDFSVSGITDYNSNIIEYISTDNINNPCVGFKMTGNQICLLNSRLNGANTIIDEDTGEILDNTLIPLSVVEGKRMRISYVVEPKTKEWPMCLAYVNGILAGATILKKTDNNDFKEINTTSLKINSDNAQINIYGLRVYANALDDSQIVSNYTASLPTLAEQQEKFNDTNIYYYNEKTQRMEINYTDVSSENYNLKIPYMLLTGGYPTYEKDKWVLQGGEPSLPTGKKTYKMVDVEIHYPDIEYFKTGLGAGLANTVYKFKNEFADGKTMAEATGESPINGGCIMYVQGTSSTEYPVKNLRIRQKSVDSYFTVRKTLPEVEIICMKADYMDSSGSNNTGTANYVDDCYRALNIQTPGQKHFDNTKSGSVVTCIKGYPCIIFYSKDGKSYEYIGKYNLNLDKATPEPFGFAHDDSDFGYEKDQNGDLILDDNGKKINSIYCFEFLDNAVEVCNFQIKDPYDNYKDTWYKTYTDKEGKVKFGWEEGFESRYPELDDVKSDSADALYPLASWLNELQTLREKEENEDHLTPDDMDIEIVYGEATKYNEKTQYYLQDEDGGYIQAYPTEEQFNTDGKTYYEVTSDNSVFKMTSLERFKKEYQCYFDKDFLLTYYIITEALLMVDSRVKNLMLATWGKEKRTYIDITDDNKEKTSFNYIFYPIFYDMDTAVGLDNAGKPRFDYYDEDTDSNIYNGKCYLWNFVRDALFQEVKAQFNAIESANKMSKDTILPYYNDNQANMANEAFYNGDGQYKYILPAIEGYYDGLNGKDIAPGDAPYLYAAQGNRDLAREKFIENRLSYLKGKHTSNNFTTSQVAEFRWNYPTKKGNGGAIDKSIEAVPPDGIFDFESLQTCYAGVMLGKNASGIQYKKFNGSEKQQIIVPNATNANGTEAYLLGLKDLKDIGDLSSKYVQKFVFTTSDLKLEKLILGNSKQGYNNTFWQGSEAIGLTGCTYLKYFNLENCPYYMQSLDFSNSPAIETIRTTGSGVNSITLPKNGVLKELRLPPYIKSLELDNHKYLTKFSIGTYNYKTEDVKEEMDYDDESRFVNDYTSLTSVSIKNTPIDTYTLLCNAFALNEYNIQGFNWNITEANDQFIKTSDLNYDDSKTYYTYNSETKTYIEIEKSQWGKVIATEKVSMKNGNQIVCIPLLERLINLAGGSLTASLLSGTININVEGDVKEIDLYNKYNKIFPNVEITYGSKPNVTKAYTLRFYNLDTMPTDSEVTNDTYQTFFKVKFDSSLDSSYRTLKYLTSAEGPNGTIGTPKKESTKDTVFTHTGQWKMRIMGSSVVSEKELDSTVVDKDCVFIPVYETSDRTYKVTLYDDSNNEMYSQQFIYNYDLGNADNVNFTYQYKFYDNSDDPYSQYYFTGWRSAADYDKKAIEPTYPLSEDITDAPILDGYLVESNIELYATFKLKDARNTPTNVNYFNVDSSKAISLKEKYREGFKGILNIPTFGNANQIGIIQNNVGITKILFDDGKQFIKIAQNAIKNCGSLEEFEMNKLINLEDIGSNAFENCFLLKLDSLPDTVTQIQNDAFNKDAKITISKLPKNIIRVGISAFYNAINLGISEFETSNPEGLTIGGTAFSGAGKEVKNILIGNNIISIGTNAFQNYGASDLMPYCRKENWQDYGVPYGTIGLTKEPTQWNEDTWVG